MQIAVFIHFRSLIGNGDFGLKPFDQPLQHECDHPVDDRQGAVDFKIPVVATCQDLTGGSDLNNRAGKRQGCTFDQGDHGIAKGEERDRTCLRQDHPLQYLEPGHTERPGGVDLTAVYRLDRRADRL